MPTRSTIISMSCRICEEKKTVLPCVASERMSVRRSLRPMGSRPEKGSSRMSRSGSLIRAWARPRRWIIPLENLRSFRSSWPLRPTRWIRAAILSWSTAAGRSKSDGGEAEQLAGGEVVVKIGVLGKEADAAPRRRRPGGLAVDQDLAGVRGQQSHDAFDGGGLAGAVRPQEAVDLALFHVEVDAFQDRVFLEKEIRAERFSSGLLFRVLSCVSR